MTVIDPNALRSAFGAFMTGITIVTARSPDGAPVGFTANSFTSVSLDPPLLLVCPGKFLSSYPVFANATHFAVSILAEDQQDASNIFASSKGDRFGQVKHFPDKHGIPLIEGAVAHFSCRTHQAVPAGDHSILVGQVEEFSHQPGLGLGYVGGRYFSLGLEQSTAHATQSPVTCGAIIEYGDSVLLEETSDGYQPIQVTVKEQGSLRDALAAGLAARGIEAEIHQVYSDFDEPHTAKRFTYFLSAATALPAGPGIVATPAQSLSGLKFANPALSTMMARFAFEARTRDFSLYLGDAQKGDIHRLSQRN